MAINKLPNGKWQAQVLPNGRDGKRIRRQFATKGEAQSYEKFVKEQAQDKPWLGEKADKRRVIELVELWFNTHGITLADGEKRRTTMAFACEAMGNPLATEFNAKNFCVLSRAAVKRQDHPFHSSEDSYTSHGQFRAGVFQGDV